MVYNILIFVEFNLIKIYKIVKNLERNFLWIFYSLNSFLNFLPFFTIFNNIFNHIATGCNFLNPNSVAL